jgi:hypothetical protein
MRSAWAICRHTCHLSSAEQHTSIEQLSSLEPHRHHLRHFLQGQRRQPWRPGRTPLQTPAPSGGPSRRCQAELDESLGDQGGALPRTTPATAHGASRPYSDTRPRRDLSTAFIRLHGCCARSSQVLGSSRASRTLCPHSEAVAPQVAPHLLGMGDGPFRAS